MTHVSVYVWKDAVATPWSCVKERLISPFSLCQIIFEDVLEHKHISRPKLRGNVDHRVGKMQVLAGSLRDPGVCGLIKPSTKTKATTRNTSFSPSDV